MAKRSYNRRSDDQIIDELESRIKSIEQRMEARRHKESPVLKEFGKVKRSLAKFSQLCMDEQRNDLSNTVMAFLATIDQQVKQSERDFENTRETA